MIYSHPDKLLIDHLANVYQLGKKIFAEKKLNFTNLTEIEQALSIILLAHDFGKASNYFQLKLKQTAQQDQSLEQDSNIDLDLSKHSLISALLAYQFADEILKDKILVWIVFITIYRHHSNFKDLEIMLNIADIEWIKLEKQFEQIDFVELDRITLEISEFNFKPSQIKFDSLKSKFSDWRFRKKIRNFQTDDQKDFTYYLISNLLFSILVFADKAEAIFYSKGYSFADLKKVSLKRKTIPDDLVDNYRRAKGWDKSDNKINKKRNEIYNEAVNQINRIDLENDRILSLNVPTGSGKTLSVFSAALKLRKRISQNFRIIYSLPFTSIIDQNYDVFLDVLSNSDLEIDSSIIIKHHYLNAKKYYLDEENNEKQKFDYDISRHLVESWQSEFVVTTFVQLLHSMFSNRNRSLIKFHNLSNSIIILDEVQNIPHKYWLLIKEFLVDLAEKLNCYFIFLTATMPLIYNEKKSEIKELAINKIDHFKFFDRIKLDTRIYNKGMNMDQFKKFIKAELIEFANKSFLIILNTIKTSLDIYQYLEELKTAGIISADLIYLSTNIIPGERIKRIKAIKKEKSPIIVSTQMVEAGVDIDLDRVYRDFAPLDSINQSCGRCNRNFDQNNKGTVKLFKLINENHNNKEYAAYIYDDILLNITSEIINEFPEIIAEHNFFKMNQHYFKKINQVKSDDSSENLLSKIKSLRYEKSFFKDGDKEVFNLIVNNYRTVNLFMAVDEFAEKIWEAYLKIRNIAGNDLETFMCKKAKFEEIKKEFLSYVITIPEKVAQKHLSDEQLQDNFNYISPFQIDDVYYHSTGFKRGEVEIQSFF
ncbi:CRISPR-associated helicase Cas3' [Halanaerobium salsuginis]|jgi:CRISPR-associated endonuclease/helicase Cas3|uniref:CRISPR-associated endonuclease/helicase Cas3 n=1 Tax=Halanaerobium salsuginis TaxID=29563 RepID=A0A1I4M2L2_9FIRM|nr:CRISPR-associated helicase Cas3' [Halanaerobium salsuginis]SFL97207.1 CRISPR-associated endonuclease/helicase Cas3 [Halanaerobium salsuginis]